MEFIGEKVAYLKGLAEGLKIDDSSKEGQVIKGILDVLDSMVEFLDDLEDECAELSEHLDEVDEDLSALEEDFYDEDEDDGDFFEIECPECKDKIFLDDDMLDTDDDILCPNCGKAIEFDLSNIDCECSEEGCGCK